MDGYNDAKCIEDSIMDIIMKNPISERNAKEYLKFVRTLRHTLNNIEDMSDGLLLASECKK
jgi:hypothetical protein